MIWVTLFLLVASSTAVQAGLGNSDPGNTVFVSPAICDGVTDARAPLQDILAHNAGKTIVLPDAQFADHSRCG